MTVERFPDRLSCRLPAGWRQRVEDAAARNGQSPAEWMRALIRKALDAAARADRRRRSRQ